MQPKVAPPVPRGVTLVELVIAILILSLGTLATWRSIGQAQRGLGEHAARVIARQVALNRAAELQHGADGLPAEVSMGRITWQIETQTLPTEAGFIEATIIVRSADGPGARLVAYVTPTPDAAP